MIESTSEPRDLVFAVCHEIGNLVAAIGLEAHLLDDEQDPLGLARAAISIEDLAARVGALLMQVRPLLEPPGPGALGGGVDPAALLANLRDSLREFGGRRVALEIESESALPRVVGDPERINTLLVLLGLGSLDSAPAGTSVRVRAVREATSEVVSIELADDGPEDRELASWQDAACRGRVLVLRVADAVVRPLGGSVSQERRDGANHTVLRLPLAK